MKEPHTPTEHHLQHNRHWVTCSCGWRSTNSRLPVTPHAEHEQHLLAVQEGVWVGEPPQEPHDG